MRSLIPPALLVLASLGCGGGENARISRGEGVAPPSPLEASRAGMKSFIEESRSLLRDMEPLPDRDVYKKRAEAIREVYARIPAPPEGNPALEECRKQAKQIARGFEVGNINLELLASVQQPAEKFAADMAINGFRILAGNLKPRIDELESAVTENRMPKPIPVWKD